MITQVANHFVLFVQYFITLYFTFILCYFFQSAIIIQHFAQTKDIIMLRKILLIAIFATASFGDGIDQQNRQQKMLEMRKNSESQSHHERINILSQAEECIQGASTKEAYRQCEETERNQRKAFKENQQQKREEFREKRERFREKRGEMRGGVDQPKQRMRFQDRVDGQN